MSLNCGADLDVMSNTPIHYPHLRSVHACDRQRVRAFLHRLSPATVSARYLGAINLTGVVEELEVTRLLGIDPAVHMVIVAVADDQIRGIAEYVVHAPGCADVGMVVEDAFQGRGIGKALLRSIIHCATAHGIQRFTADVAASNYRMIALLREAGRAIRTELSYGCVTFEMLLDSALHPAAGICLGIRAAVS